MYSEFNILSLAENESDVPINSIIKKLPNKLYKKYLMKKLPFIMKDMTYIGETGQNIILPFTNTSIEEMDCEFIKKFISNLLLKCNITNVYSSDFLKKYIEQVNISYQSLLKYIVLDQIVRKVLKDNNTIWKNTKLVIIDSEDTKIDYLLELFVGNLNFLTIITKRQEYFNDIKEMIYVNTGLVVDIIENPAKEGINGNIIIDANKDLCKNYCYFEKNATIIDLESNNTKMQYLYSRRKDLQIIYDVTLMARGQDVENNLLGYILCTISHICAKFVNNSHRTYRVKDLLEIAEQYNIVLKELRKTERN